MSELEGMEEGRSELDELADRLKDEQRDSEVELLRQRVEVLEDQTGKDREIIRKLTQSEVEYRAVMDAAASPIVLHDLSGRFTYVNPAFTRVFGWTAEEAVGKRLDFVPPESLREAKDALNRLLAGEKVTGFETRRLTQDGQTLDVEMSAAIYHQANGEAAGSVIIYRNISERKKTERALREAEDRASAVMAASPDPIVMFDTDGRVLYTNPAFTSVFGWTQKEVQGQALDFIPQTAMDENQDAFKRMMARGSVMSFETQRLTKDNRPLHLKVTASVFKAHDGRPAGSFVILHPVGPSMARRPGA
ncbi:MAG: PAS domain S-box protein [Proteobacteria bacterium]|nr:PAS domain S-box protein [Pseudomonadota bacterium]